MDALQCIQGINDCSGQEALVVRFAALNTIYESEVNTMNLPTLLVEWRKHRALVFCAREYFDFVCLVESIFLANLTL